MKFLKFNIGPIVDIPHGYLQMIGEAESYLTVCLFRKTNGLYLVAAHFIGGEEDIQTLEFFEYRVGHPATCFIN